MLTEMTKNPTNSASGTAIAFCENGAGYGGAVISLAAFLEQLPATYSAHLYTALATPPYQQLARLGAWRQLRPVSLLNRARLERSGIPFASTVDNLFNMLPTALRYYFAFKRDRIALVYLNNDAVCNIAAAVAARMAGLPTILHARGFHGDSRGSRWVLGNVRHCIAVSTAVREGLLALGMRPEQCTVVAEGLDLTQFRPRPPSPALRAELGIDEGQPVITRVGGLVDWTGQDVLLDAAPAILARHPGAHILLVGAAYGADRAFADMIAARSASAAFGGRVRLLGGRADVAEILALSTVVLHASTKPEPFGRTFLEGMALGKAVIASNEGGPLDVIEHGVDGLLIAPRDPSILSAAVLRLLEDPALAASLGHNAARTALNYSIEKHTAAICALLPGITARQ